MVVHAAVAVVALADVLDLEVLVAVDQAGAVDAVGLAKVALVDAEVTVRDAVFRVLVIVVAAADALDVVGVLDVVDLVKVVQGVQDVEAHVQAHAHQAVKDRLVLHAMAVLAVLVRVLHARHALDATDAPGAVHNAADVLGALTAAKVAAPPNVADVQADVILHAVDAQEAVVDVQADVVDVQGAVRDAMAHVPEHAMGVVMDAVVDAKTHVLLPARQRVQVPAKLKHLAP